MQHSEEIKKKVEIKKEEEKSKQFDDHSSQNFNKVSNEIDQILKQDTNIISNKPPEKISHFEKKTFSEEEQKPFESNILEPTVHVDPAVKQPDVQHETKEELFEIARFNEVGSSYNQQISTDQSEQLVHSNNPEKKDSRFKKKSFIPKVNKEKINEIKTAKARKERKKEFFNFSFLAKKNKKETFNPKNQVNEQTGLPFEKSAPVKAEKVKSEKKSFFKEKNTEKKPFFKDKSSEKKPFTLFKKEKAEANEKSDSEQKMPHTEVVTEGKEETIQMNQNYSNAVDEDLIKFLKVADDLLGKLPEHVINEFASSEDFALYQKIMEKYKIK